jgi:hypothetical protein
MRYPLHIYMSENSPNFSCTDISDYVQERKRESAPASAPNPTQTHPVARNGPLALLEHRLDRLGDLRSGLGHLGDLWTRRYQRRETVQRLQCE